MTCCYAFSMEQQASFGKMMADAMERRELNQEQMAEAVGSTQSYVSLLMRDKRKPSADLAKAIAVALEAPVDDFLLAAGYRPESPLSVWSRVPDDWAEQVPRTAHPPTPDEITRLTRIPLWFDLGNKDPRKDKSFWSLDRATRKRLLMHYEAIWDEYSELMSDTAKDGT